MTKILMCGSTLNVKGGMVSVIKNYLNFADWGEVKIVYVPTHTDGSKYYLVLFFFFAYIRIFFLALFRKVEVAHLHTAERGSFYRKALLAKTLKSLGIKVILHHHGAEFEDFYKSLSPQRKSYVRKILEGVDLNIVLSKRQISMISNKAPNARISVLYNAVNTYEQNPYNRNAKNILMLGRLGKRKGAYDLLEAIKIIDNQIAPEIKFYMCGDGELEEVRNMAKEMCISHRIAHIGWIDGEQKTQFLANTMINVLPSYNEGLPMTILETMSYGIPNISTNIASIPEVIDSGNTGFLIEPGDVRTLADNITSLAQSKPLQMTISNASYKLICDNFSLSKNISQLIVTYQNLIN